MRQLWSCYARYYKQVLFVVLGSCVTAALDITFPMIVRNILETVLPFANIQRLCWLSGLLFILYGVSLFFLGEFIIGEKVWAVLLSMIYVVNYLSI